MYGECHPDLESEYIEQEMKNLDPSFNWSFQFILEYARRNNEICKVYQNYIPPNPDAVVTMSWSSDLLKIVDSNGLEMYNAVHDHHFFTRSSAINAYLDPRSCAYPFTIGSNVHIRELQSRTPEDLPEIYPEIFKHVPSIAEIIGSLRTMNVNMGEIFKLTQNTLKTKADIVARSELSNKLYTESINGRIAYMGTYNNNAILIDSTVYEDNGDIISLLQDSLGIGDNQICEEFLESDDITRIVIEDASKESIEVIKQISSEIMKIMVPYSVGSDTEALHKKIASSRSREH
jgi:hypothetical protein